MPSNEDNHSGRIVACLVLFAVAMGLVSWLLHIIVPPASAWADDTVGTAPHGLLLLAALGACAIFGYRPLVKGWLTNRRLQSGRGAGDQAGGEDLRIPAARRGFGERP
jgi:hypothetical protein